MNKSILRKALLIQRQIENKIDSDSILKDIHSLMGKPFELYELDQLLKNVGTSGFIYNGESYFCKDGCNVTNNYQEYVIDWFEQYNLYTITKVFKRA
jgi:hypothetical protein